jgi:hypothetical protein
MRGRAQNDLRLAVRCLPRHTREAMVEGIRRNDIIVGAYTDRSGGVCPMLAAHRCGGRTDFLAFAKAWDRFARAKRPRRATEREIAVLVSYLQETLLDGDADLAAAISDHQRTARARRAREAERVGWGWLAESELERLPDLEPGLLEHDLRDRAAR